MLSWIKPLAVRVVLGLSFAGFATVAQANCTPQETQFAVGSFNLLFGGEITIGQLADRLVRNLSQPCQQSLQAQGSAPAPRPRPPTPQPQPTCIGGVCCLPGGGPCFAR
ncbi:hypothetical protein GCM10009416_14270 [Craurococcus roseus]|uniref:Uncharacterized protein n=1 Tax=Craurococcus roseus TaxID=77585 RepID=A0ABN1EYB2_9PROT